MKNRLLTLMAFLTMILMGCSEGPVRLGEERPSEKWKIDEYTIVEDREHRHLFLVKTDEVLEFKHKEDTKVIGIFLGDTFGERIVSDWVEIRLKNRSLVVIKKGIIEAHDGIPLGSVIRVESQ